ncbi:toll/interleukin-1 receptor domain-containing protein [Hyphococcus sp.]|uniref:toll/interleukin-1 receptor domain-containing protein n=1 Tax=Hyphococcus sp. TaxID=2038636 RepID=UPI0035C6FAF6
MLKVLTVGLKYEGEKIADVEIDNLGLCRGAISDEHAAYPLYEYDLIIINPATYSHFLFGGPGEFSDSETELADLKSFKDDYDLDALFYGDDRQRELEAALKEGAAVVWCLSEPRRRNFFGYRTTHLGYVHAAAEKAVRDAGIEVKKGRRLNITDRETPFAEYYESLAVKGWRLCFAETPVHYRSFVETPDGYTLGGRFVDELDDTVGWFVTPPTDQASANLLIRNALGLIGENGKREAYHSIFLSHTGEDKPFARKLRDELIKRGVPNVWIDEAEIQIGDSLIRKIEKGIDESRYFGVVLSPQAVEAEWVQREVEIAMTNEIKGEEVIVLPLLFQECNLPGFLKGKLYADFRDDEKFEGELEKLLRRLRVA